MMRALIIKELQGNFRWLALGLAIMLVLAWAAVPKTIDASGSSLSGYLGFASAIFAFSLGLLQSVGDAKENQKGFLYHRALTQQAILGGKLIAGFIIYAVALGIPLTLVTIYFAMMGPQQLPVRPLQVLRPAILVTLCYLIHPATILVVQRPARWFGTRLLPLIAPVFICFMFSTTYYNSYYWAAAFGVFFPLLTFLGLGVLYPSIQKVSLGIGATFASAACMLFGLWIPLILLMSQPHGDWTSFVVDDAGEMWQVKYRSEYDQKTLTYKTKFISGGLVMPNQPINPGGNLPKDFHGRFAYPGTPIRITPRSCGEIRATSRAQGKTLCYDDRGYFLLYDSKNYLGLVAAITRGGLTSDVSSMTNRFDSPMINELYASKKIELVDIGTFSNDWTLFPDRKGIYVLNRMSGELEIVLDAPISMIYQCNKERDIVDSFIAQTDQSLVHYKLADSKASRPIFAQVATYPKLPQSEVSQWSLAVAANGTLAAFGWDQSRRGKLATLIPGASSQWQIDDVAFTNPTKHPPGLPAFIGSAPAILLLPTLSLVVVKHWTEGSLVDLWQNSEYPIMPVVGLACAWSVVFILVSSAAVLFLLRSRCTDRKATIAWLLLCIPLGIGAPLALISICPKLKFDNCTGCNRPRRIDRSKCEHCHNDWEPLQGQGIEVVESGSPANAYLVH